MSLDISLIMNFAGLPEPETVFDYNITHNLTKMADEAGIYQCIWRPEEIGIEKAKQLIEPLTIGLKKLESDPEYFKKFSAPNGWGKYDNLIKLVKYYLDACKKYPEAKVEVWR